MAPKNAQSIDAEITLAHLQKCLVNLPSSLVNLIESLDKPAQNVVVELSYRTPAQSSDGASHGSSQRSLYLGWTGMPSQHKTAPIVDRDGINGSRGGGRGQQIASVEIDATFAASMGVYDGQKVTATLHLDPTTAHTLNIEPLTPEDWDIIELHADFLEVNLISQIRAVPNPQYKPEDTKAPVEPHHLTVHLTPTSSANFKVVSLEPVPNNSCAFVKIAPDSEVIVAPKVRAKASRGSRTNGSVGGASRRSGKSSASTVRRRSGREEKRPSMFLRCIDRSVCAEYFDDNSAVDELTVWVDRDLLLSREFRGVNYVVLNVVKPGGLQPPLDPQKQQAAADSTKPAEKIVAQLQPWDDPPNVQSAALSTPLCASLGCLGTVGGVVKIEPAPQPLSRSTIQHLKIFPFGSDDASATKGLKFGGGSKAEKEEAAKLISRIYGQTNGAKGLLHGPLTDGMVLGRYDSLEMPQGWEGGIVKLESSSSQETLNWCLGSERLMTMQVQPSIPTPSDLEDSDPESDPASSDTPLVGIDRLLGNLTSNLSHMSSVLLTGALGSGKTSVAKALARTLREDYLFHTSYFPCRKLVNDESRIATIKETLTRVFMTASWGARLGGHALVVLDDLDKLCPVETELQVGNDNGRSRQLSETICSIVRQFCGKNGNVVLLTTAQGKDSLNNVVIGGHVVREIIDLKAPDKDARRKVMEAVVKQWTIPSDPRRVLDSEASRPTTADGSSVTGEDGAAWMDGASQPSRSNSISKPKSDGFLLDADLDFLDLAGETDGYMPGDLLLLVSRARNEALIRSVSESLPGNKSMDIVQLAREDFDNALKGFTPASLRNVNLQTSTTTFDSIGGLKETRQILLETLQYPTKYSPIFAQCPLRLRSGLLLYGFPGCGKTLLASAVAGECGLNFISVKGPEILNKYIGASEKSVRDLFERASAAKPCVLFFDEFDSIAPKRGHDSTGVTDRVVNQLLTQMDGAEGLSGVYVLAATSRPDLIDPALLRPGRLDKSLLCDFPNLEDRVDIITALGKKVKMHPDVVNSEEALVEIGRRTEGFSGADLQALMSNAQLEAIHDVLSQDATLQAPSGNKRGSSAVVSNKARNFIQFRYGENESNDEKKGFNRSAELVENAAIAAKLAEIKAARKRGKLAQKASTLNGDAGDNDKDKKDGNSGHNEPRIAWSHMVKALESSRASISTQERRRLEGIYREFVAGRSGEMRDGQGSTEIGGRSSLM